jgi:hypothetical protein
MLVAVLSQNVSIVGLKRLAERTLKEGSQLRSLILAEPDELPKEEYIVRAKVYARLLEQELRNPRPVCSQLGKAKSLS